MSASLVGSEMCIRDRPFSPSESQLAQTHRRIWWASAAEIKFSHLEVHTCLLYTSDAADDM
eukprot:12172546-Alexandrium_andersonii.AAC.1